MVKCVIKQTIFKADVACILWYFGSRPFKMDYQEIFVVFVSFKRLTMFQRYPNLTIGEFNCTNFVFFNGIEGDNCVPRTLVLIVSTTLAVMSHISIYLDGYCRAVSFSC